MIFDQIQLGQMREWLSEFLLKRIPTQTSMRHSWLHRWFGDGVLAKELWIPSRHSMALGIAMGWLIGLWPVFGIQIALSLILGYALRCHLPTVVLGTFISNPLTTPAILVLQYKLGHWMWGLGKVHLAMHAIGSHLVLCGTQIMLGAAASSLLAASLGYLLAWMFWTIEEMKTDG